ncbi:MBL fold metallo-hydrolase [Tistrella bauzanensis]|uniref:MBL fold metallo-hydrolase n=1 Tax=Tistrella bauzanensis TaxID=657419 RepID=A0ABQ1IU84_9PROT|nr:MBL fold metallo-hydrolase [Tistrella bauzanensis]GGB51384.1 MBL fold metallo-hydrolase [Tistrella bauzanensis]
MSSPISYRREMPFDYGRLETVAPGLRRIVARNPSAFTFHGTGTYVVGEGRVAVIDPGPYLPEHVAALLAGLGDERVSHILVTHTHNDHSPAAALLKQATGAESWAFGPHGAGRAGADGGGAAAVEEGGDRDFQPDHLLADGDVIAGQGWTIEAVHTPGHTSNHLCFGWREARTLFSGDHVMGWSTSVIAPPDGEMAAYLASLHKLLDRDDAVYWPTHGPAITDPHPHVRAFIAHRQAREDQILAALAAGPARIMEMVPAMYQGTDPRLFPAAARSVLAHLLHLETRGLVTAGDGAPLDAIWQRG